MALIRCKECGREISGSAKACPGCGKRPPDGYWGYATIVLLVVFAILVLASGGSPSAKNPFPADVYTSAGSITVKPTGGKKIPEGLKVYVNGLPIGSSYCATASAYLTPTGDARIPLSAFINGSGRRMDPVHEAAVTIWVGGAGFDYSSYGGRR